MARESQRDQHALAHAARKLMRIVRQQRLRPRQVDGFQQFDRAFAATEPPFHADPRQVLVELGSYAPDGVQRRERVLRDESDLATQ